MKKASLSVMIVFSLLCVALGPTLSNSPGFTIYSHGAEH